MRAIYPFTGKVTFPVNQATAISGRVSGLTGPEPSCASMPIAMTRTPLSLHAIPRSSPYLNVREREGGRRVRVSDAMIAELRSLRPPGKLRRQVAREANRPRAIPDATLIQAWLDGIEDRPLQWAFALVATHGLRPHEVFHLESLSPMPTAGSRWVARTAPRPASGR